MENVTTDQLASAVEVLRREVDELRAGLDYAVYGIGTAHQDPRDEGDPVA